MIAKSLPGSLNKLMLIFNAKQQTTLTICRNHHHLCHDVEVKDGAVLASLDQHNHTEGALAQARAIKLCGDRPFYGSRLLQQRWGRREL